MHLHTLPTSLILLTLSMTSLAAPIPHPNGMHCGSSAISFLSPRYQTILGLRQYCSSVYHHDDDLTLSRRDLSELDLGDLDDSFLPDFIGGPPDELSPFDLLEAQSNKLKDLDVDYELKLASLRNSMRRRKHHHHHPDGDSRPLSFKTATEHLARLGDYTSRDVQHWVHSVVATIESIDEHIVLAGVGAIIGVVLALFAFDMVIARRRLSRQRRRRLVMRRVVRRGTRVRVQLYPFSLATIAEEKPLSQPHPSPLWEEKSTDLIAITPSC